ncbi:thioredoxin family protein [Sphingobacterium sp. N143]|uniref:TlpA family protein disulfide reductase n=1 Tax=Sphingobacterium sp. N143 TaxID=2746727 RepID=UPI002578BC30|nr:thioredoxin family protein [Sphingobacterium sp. N143]MDM1295909.1 thioredoxin family protein [Sphingobacterium sp. N143]
MKNIIRFQILLWALICTIIVNVNAQNKLSNNSESFGDSYFKLEVQGNTSKKALLFKLTLTSNLTSYYDINFSILGNADTLLKIPSFKLTSAILKTDNIERYIFLLPNDTTKVIFNFDSNISPYIQYYGPYEAIFRETKTLQSLFSSLFNENSSSNKYVFEPNAYRDRALSSMREKIDKINNTPLSMDSKISLHRTFAAVYTRMFLLDPNNGMYIDNVNAGMDKEKAKIKNKINLDYYTFLRELDLNNKDYLLSNYYNELTKSLLADSVLNLPVTDNISLKDWMKKTSAILHPLLGYSKGYFYNIMLANAYLDQIARSKLLSDEQSKDIIGYFKDKSFSDYLLYQNSINGLRIVNDTGRVYDWSNLKKGDVLSEIIKKYPDKTIVIDFWATWCAPCLTAMDKIKPIKEKYNNVVFVYITDVSSPRTLWNNQVKGIAGNHFYLSSLQMEKLQKKINFSSIPTYLIYNKNGELIDKLTGFPGSQKFEEILRNAEK